MLKDETVGQISFENCAPNDEKPLVHRYFVERSLDTDVRCTLQTVLWRKNVLLKCLRDFAPREFEEHGTERSRALQ